MRGDTKIRKTQLVNMKQDIDEANTNFTESHKYKRPTLDDRLGRGGGDAILVVNSIRFLSPSFPPSSFGNLHICHVWARQKEQSLNSTAAADAGLSGQSM